MAKINYQNNGASINGLTVISPTIHTDNRGRYKESFSEKEYENILSGIHFVQDNQSVSHRGGLRGMYFQTNHTQGK